MARRIVLDANATLGLFLRLPYSENIIRQMQEWQEQEAKIIVPILWEYECLTGLRRAVVLKLVTQQVAEQMVEQLLALEFHRVIPSLKLHQNSLAWAEKIGQSKIYDAQYLALTESLSADFWTADQRLFHTLGDLGVPWAHVLYAPA